MDDFFPINIFTTARISYRVFAKIPKSLSRDGVQEKNLSLLIEIRIKTASSFLKLL